MNGLVFEELTDGPIDYLAAWDLQREVHQRSPTASSPTRRCCSSTRRLHRRQAHPAARPARDPHGAPVIDVDRGGTITFHGPGQLVGYPIVTLPDHVKVVDYVRRVEEALIPVCADLGVTTARVPGRSGVWLQADDRAAERKIAALGIRVSRGVTMHGFSLNCDVDLAWFDRFVPVQHRRRRRHLSQQGARSRRHGRRGAPVVEQHLGDFLAWAPYDATPDYEPRQNLDVAPRHPRSCVSPCSSRWPDPRLRHAETGRDRSAGRVCRPSHELTS